MSKRTPFFSHDMNARHDTKISAMRGVYGAQGYGWWWVLIEIMAETEGYQLDCKSKYVFNAYAMQMQCKSEEAHKFITDCIHEFDLFESDGDHFWSNSLRKRMQYRDAVSEKRAEAANKRWNKSNSDANASEYDANAMQNDANETKQNKTIKDNVDSDECDLAFEEWYSTYPKEGSVRKKAAESWRKLWKAKKIDLEEIAKGTKAYLAHQAHKQYSVCGAQVFLNQERWKDSWELMGKTSSHTPNHLPLHVVSKEEEDEHARIVERIRQQNAERNRRTSRNLSIVSSDV